MKKHNILITGGNGFIGINLCLRLLAEGHNVISIDNFYSSNKDKQRIFRNAKNYTFIEHDVRYPLDDILSTFNSINQVYHLACPASPKRYQANPIYTHETSIYGMVNVLKYCKEHDTTLMFSSTSEIYGDPQVDIQGESYKGNTNTVGKRSCYDESKRMCETLCRDYAEYYGMDIKIARIFNTYGPYMEEDDGRVISNFITQLLRGKELTIYGTGTQGRSFCYIDDTINGLILLMNSPLNYSPVNIGNPVQHTILDVAHIIKKQLNIVDHNRIFKDLPEDDPRMRCPDISKARSELKWNPTTDISEGLEKTIKYFNSQKIDLTPVES